MVTKNMEYAHPTYVSREGQCLGEAGGAATTAYAKFAAFTAMKLYALQATVSVAGTAAGHGFGLVRISGTATTTLGTQTIGTAAAGTTFNLVATNVSDGVNLNQGDIVEVVSLSDVVGKAVIAYEVMAAPLANVTA
jgi:hypothetical protein